MMTITIELPDEVGTYLQQDWGDLERHALEAFAVEAYRQGQLSSGGVGQILGMSSRVTAANFLSEKGVYPNYGIEDFEDDVQTLERMRQESIK